MLIVAATGARWSVYSRDIGGLRWCVAHRSSTKSFRAATWSERFVRLETFPLAKPEAAKRRFGRRSAKRYPLPGAPTCASREASTGTLIPEETRGAPGPHGKVTA